MVSPARQVRPLAKPGAGPILTEARHHFISGTTGSGKSHMARHICEHWPGPVLFVNIQDDDLLSSWARVEYDQYTSAEVLALLAKYKRLRLNFIPHFDEWVAPKLVQVLVRRAMYLMPVWQDPLLIAIDEADKFSPQGKKGTATHELVQRGRKRGVFGLIISQFPADVDKGVLRNCTVHSYFHNPYVGDYYERYHLPGDQIRTTLARAGQFNFVQVAPDGSMSGPFKV